MKSFKKKAARVLYLVMLVLIALCAGLAGGIMPPRKRESLPITIELAESREDRSDKASEEYKP